MIDEKLTKQIQDWLDAPESERLTSVGAELMLRLNRNRVLYQNIMRRPDKMKAKLVYELKKHLRIRLDKKTIEDVATMSRKLMPAAQELLATHEQAEHSGKRSDHDTLPDDIRTLYDKNGAIYDKIKQTYNELLSMEDSAPCDRYEQLCVLADLDAKYRANWKLYDTFSPDTVPSENGEQSPADVAKSVSAARKYISENLKKLCETENIDDRGELHAKIQQRIDHILSTGATFADKYRQKLLSEGFTL